ncbi:MAG: phosphate signaling complex protein PhoU [Epulopiscium sp.]|nr:phosphate signaling complex protein PhoU [Candidatus Epulonipiscium sp.]
MRYQFQQELKHLHKELLKIGSQIERSLQDAMEALLERNEALAHLVIQRDDEIDDGVQKIENECIRIIARQQPAAGDLRFITSTLKMVTDLERIADHCADICEYTLKLTQELLPQQKKPMMEMGVQVKKMVRMTIDSYVSQNLSLAQQVCKEDDIVDEYFLSFIHRIEEEMEKNKGFITQGIYLLLIVKYLERMADHSTNIAEWILYQITGTYQEYN